MSIRRGGLRAADIFLCFVRSDSKTDPLETNALCIAIAPVRDAG